MKESKTSNVSWDVWKLNTPADMWECLEELVALGYRGSIRCGPNAEGSPVWLLEIGQDAPKEPVLANIGYVFVLLGARLECLSLADYEAIYGVH